MVNDASDYPWSSYRAMTGQEPAPDWLETDWLLSQFAKQRSRAIGQYIDFVRAGVGLPSIWSQTRNQIFLGSNEFVEKHKSSIEQKESLSDIPKAQRREPVKPLGFYQEKYGDRNRAIASAYLSGGYTKKQVGDFFGCQYTTVSRIVKEFDEES